MIFNTHPILMPLACCFSFRLLQLKLFFVKADDFMYISVVKIYVIPKWCLVTKIKLSLKYVSQKSRGPQILMNEFADRNWKLSSLIKLVKIWAIVHLSIVQQRVYQSRVHIILIS